ALLSRIKFDMINKKRYYDEAFERLQFTIKSSGTLSEEEYFNNLERIVCSNYKVYEKKVNQIEQTANSLDSNIQQLRSDLDRKSNIGIQTSMFILSLDRKSTRLNSSHVSISYAVFCLKKK